jgi:hypothetical protein
MLEEPEADDFGQAAHAAFLFEATVCVGRSTGTRPVADASLVIGSVELRCILLASSCAAYENGNRNQGCNY